jgi:hypothetical protein
MSTLVSKFRPSVLSMDICEPEESVRFLCERFFWRRMRASLKNRPNAIFISSTMFSGVQSGRVHAVMLLWKPFTMNLDLGGCSRSKRVRNFQQTGQHNLDTPTLGP